MNEKLSLIQKVLLETFKAFVQFCKENDIKYYAASGTMLGGLSGIKDSFRGMMTSMSLCCQKIMKSCCH